jgi:hypothetical protein
MAIVRPEDVAGIYNFVWMSSASLADIGGMTMFAFDQPFTLRRYQSREPGSAHIWTMRFDFAAGVGMGQNNVKLQLSKPARYGIGGGTHKLPGVLTVKKVDGDLAQFQKDWVMFLMYNHLWKEN